MIQRILLSSCPDLANKIIGFHNKQQDVLQELDKSNSIATEKVQVLQDQISALQLVARNAQLAASEELTKKFQQEIESRNGIIKIADQRAVNIENQLKSLGEELRKTMHEVADTRSQLKLKIDSCCHLKLFPVEGWSWKKFS